VNLLKRLIKSAFGDERYFNARLERQFDRDQSRQLPTLFVHQMGKVGSSSIINSLKACGLDSDWRIYQTHFLTPDGLAFVESLELEKYGDWSAFPQETKRKIQADRSISNHWYAGDFAGRIVKIITLVRDPVATNLSGFFYNFFTLWPEELLDKCQQRSPGWQAELLDNFLANYPHDVPATWFDLEMKALFGIDVFKHRFDCRQGYQLYETTEHQLLLLRLESMDRELVEVIREYVGLSNLEVVRSNTARDKWYSDLYSEFKKDLILPPTYLNRMYDTAYARQFYTSEEIQRFQLKWHKS
jgi:hypothetical protein